MLDEASLLGKKNNKKGFLGEGACMPRLHLILPLSIAIY
jgi:hypothetical protein